MFVFELLIHELFAASTYTTYLWLLPCFLFLNVRIELLPLAIPTLSSGKNVSEVGDILQEVGVLGGDDISSCDQMQRRERKARGIPSPCAFSTHVNCRIAATALPASFNASKTVMETVQALVGIGTITSLVATFRMTRTLER